MFVRMIINSILAAVFFIHVIEANRYLSCLKGMQGISITCDSEEKLKLVLRHQKQKGFDFMKVSRFPRINVELLVKASKVSTFLKMLETQNIKYQVFIRDFQTIVREESELQKQFETTEPRRVNRTFFFDHFPRYATINNFLSYMAEKHREVKILDIGTSYQNRQIMGVKVSSGGRNKPAIVINSGIHGREWIAPVTTLFTLNELLKTKNVNHFQNVDWYFIPLINPDGYEFSHTRNRLWRKTRSKMRGSLCRGVDGNRNFEYMWMEVGATKEPCDSIYAGNKPFSENETRSLRNFIVSLNQNIKVFISLHSYGKYFLHPWGYTERLPQNEPILRKVGQDAADAVAELHGTQYIIGSSSLLLHPAAGGIDDWAMAMGGAELAFSIELPGYTFVINATRIKPIGLEIFEALKVFAKFAEVGIKYG